VHYQRCGLLQWGWAVWQFLLPKLAIRTDKGSLSWACTNKARWWIGREKKATQKNTSSDGCVLEICRLPPASPMLGVHAFYKCANPTSMCRIHIHLN
jgi:hypothetical protein